MLKKILLLTCLLASMTSYALEVKSANDNTSINVTLSSKSLNRIYVTTDRIVETYGIDGSYKLEKDEEQGDIFILPTGYFKNKPFDFFIKTEHGHHYTLHVTPAEIESNTIGIKPLTAAKAQAKQWEASLPYETILVDLIDDMMNDELPDGYAVVPASSKLPSHIQSNLAFRLRTIYRGDRLEGQIWTIKNIGQSAITLNPNHFHDARIRAASFDKSVLKKNDVANLYWVKANES